MDNIDQKLEEIEALIKNMGGMQLPLPKPPKPITPVAPGKVSAAPQSQKNPVNQAQQIQDPAVKKIAVKQAKSMIKFDNNGQWKLEE